MQHVTRFTRLDDLNSKFGFILDVANLLHGSQLDALRQSCQKLVEFYNTDINGEELYTKVWDCRMLLDVREEAPKMLKICFLLSYLMGMTYFPI